LIEFPRKQLSHSKVLRQKIRTAVAGYETTALPLNAISSASKHARRCGKVAASGKP
jgi:hypothetical protein